MSLFSKKVISWQTKKGRHSLPWQNKGAYEVWISEVMLQQTQVETAIPYYHKFLKTFPNLKTLANSKLDEVLSIWSGLGYYSRAKNIHKTALEIIKNHNGEMPETFEELISLPGIGPSTAGAILSLAFNQPGIILDGNVKRVISRYKGITDPINIYKTETLLKSLAKELLPSSNFKVYGQGMMDLGATLCKKSNPLCGICPLAENCIALNENLQSKIPIKKAKKPATKETLIWYIPKNNENKIMLIKRDSKGIWADLWGFEEKDKLKSDFYGSKYKIIEKRDTCLHKLSHKNLEIHPIVIELKDKKYKKNITYNEYGWFSMKELNNLGIPKPVTKIASTII